MDIPSILDSSCCVCGGQAKVMTCGNAKFYCSTHASITTFRQYFKCFFDRIALIIDLCLNIPNRFIGKDLEFASKMFFDQFPRRLNHLMREPIAYSNYFPQFKIITLSYILKLKLRQLSLCK